MSNILIAMRFLQNRMFDIKIKVYIMLMRKILQLNTEKQKLIEILFNFCLLYYKNKINEL